MRLTTHCEKRIQQRGIHPLELALVEALGSTEYAGVGVKRVLLSRKTRHRLSKKLREIVEMLESAKAPLLVMDGDTVITSYRPTQRVKRNHKHRARRSQRSESSFANSDGE